MRYQAITPILFAHYVASATIRPGPKPVRDLESVHGLELSPRQFGEPFPEQLSPGVSGPGLSFPGSSFPGSSDSGSSVPGSSFPGSSFPGSSDSGSSLPGSSFPGSFFPDQSPSAPTLPDQPSSNQPFQQGPFEPFPGQQPAKQPSPFEPSANEQSSKKPSLLQPFPDEQPSKKPSPLQPFPDGLPPNKPSLVEPLPDENPKQQPSPLQPFPDKQPSKKPAPGKPLPDKQPQKQPFPLQPPTKPSPQPSFQPNPEPTPSLEPSLMPKPKPESELSLIPILTPKPKPNPEPISSLEPVLTLKPTTRSKLDPKPTFLPESQLESTTTKTLSPKPILTWLPFTTLTLQPRPTSTESTTTSTTSSTTRSISRPTPKPEPNTSPELEAVVVDILHSQNLEDGIPFQPLMSMSFGTPPQVITGVFDTGSSDVIIPMAGSAVCQSPKQKCRGSKVALGDYDPTKDGDAKRVSNSGFAAGFEDGDTYTGPYIRTTVRVGDATIKEAQVALAVNGSVSGNSSQFAIFGMGPIDAEQTVDQGKYANLPRMMKDVGLVNANMFGVWLNPTPFAYGSAVLGGFDSSKFTGQLQSVPLEPDNSGNLSNFVVRLSSVELSMSGTGGDQRNRRPQSLQAVTMDLGLGQSAGYTSVDTGTPFIVVPSSTMENLARALGTSFSETDGLGAVDCRLASEDNSLVFGFDQDQTMVSVPLARTVISKELLDKDSSQTGGCKLAIGSAGRENALNTMGYPFMSAVYTVFDMDMQRLMFAQAV